MNQFSFDCWINNRKQAVDPSKFRFISTSFGEIRFIDVGESHLQPLVMVPDGPCFLEHFDHVVEAAKARFRVIVFDMPGFGYSVPKNGYDHSFDHASQVIGEVLTARGIQNQKVILSFSCANGFYALRFAKKFPHQIKHLFLIQTPAFRAMGPWAEKSIPKSFRLPFLGQLLAYFLRFKIPPIWFRSALPRYSSLAAEYSEKSLKEIKKGACNCLAGVVQGLARMSESDLTGVKVPVTMIWGKKDFSHRMTDPLSLKSIVPEAEVLACEEAGHFSNLEDPTRFLEIVRSRI